jgi:hypothetical protein
LREPLRVRVRVTHPFHPLAGREPEFVKRRNNWRADRVYIRDGSGELVSLPAEWTDVVAEDPFVVVAGRARCVSSRPAARVVGAGRVAVGSAGARRESGRSRA